MYHENGVFFLPWIHLINIEIDCVAFHVLHVIYQLKLKYKYASGNVVYVQVFVLMIEKKIIKKLIFNKFSLQTLVMDHTRISEQMESAHRLALISSVLMITYSTVGASISGVQALKEKLKSEICTLLEGVPERWGDILIFFSIYQFCEFNIT